MATATGRTRRWPRSTPSHACCPSPSARRPPTPRRASWGTRIADLRTTVLATLTGIECCTHLNDALRALAEVPVLLDALALRALTTTALRCAGYTPEAEAFRAEVRATIARHLPADWQGLGALDRDAVAAFAWHWRDVLRDEGLLALSWPVRYGGAGRSALEQVVLAEELTRAVRPRVVRTTGSASRCSGTRCCNGGPRTRRNGSSRGCCREKTAGARATRSPARGRTSRRCRPGPNVHGDEWIINGQKVWTSLAHEANWVFVLTRTDADRAATPRHQLLALPTRAARRRDPSDRDDQRRARVLRGVLHRCAHSRHPCGRRGERRMGGGEHPARLRARRVGGDVPVAVPRGARPADRVWRGRAAVRTTRSSVRDSHVRTRSARSCACSGCARSPAC